MTTLEHKKCGALGSEFIFHHRTYKPRRLVLSLLITSTLACALQIYELDVVLLWSMSVCLGVLLLYRLFYKVRKEAVLVLPSIGVQVKTQYWLGGLETHFFDKACVRGIVINEAVTMHSVLCYLAVLLTSGSPGHTQQLFPLFMRSWPGQQDLVYIYQAVENMQQGQPPPPSSSGGPPPPPPAPHPSSPLSSPCHLDKGQGRKLESSGEVMRAVQKEDRESADQPSARKRRRTRSLRS